MDHRFRDGWDPQVLEEEVLADAVWKYQGIVPHLAKLIRCKWDYTARDIEEIEQNVQGVSSDYLDYNIGEDGNVYFWEFENEGRKTQSPTFSSLESAAAHIETYSGTSKITWRNRG